MEQKLAIVTGSGRGIGRAIAELLAENGFHLVLTSRTATEIEAVAAEIRNKGGVATAIPCDIASSAAIEEFAKIVHAQIGTVSVLINNAGVAHSAKLEDTTDAMWESSLATNLSGAFYLARAFVPDMKALGRGHILSIASTAAYKGFNYNSAYTASKHGLLGLTRALAVELEKYNIAVNALCPGFVRTDILRKSIENFRVRSKKTEEEAEAVFAQLNEEKRLIEPEEVARLALKVLNNTTFQTGMALRADGTSIDSD